MADKPCRWKTEIWDCSHPLVKHLVRSSGCYMNTLPWVSRATCDGCPCHEPQPSVVKESLTAQPDPNGSIRPESDETAPVRVHDKP